MNAFSAKRNGKKEYEVRDEAGKLVGTTAGWEMTAEEAVQNVLLSIRKLNSALDAADLHRRINRSSIR